MTAQTSARRMRRITGSRVIARVMRASGMSLAIESALGAALAMVTAANGAVAAAYRAAWPRLGLPYWDHRYSALVGVSGWHWAERGVVARRLIRPGDAVLDICTGDGLYAAAFMAPQAAFVNAMDRDARAIEAARKRYARSNVRFFAQEAISEPFPSQHYDVISCFASLQYFAPADAARLLDKIAAALETRGTFVGSVPVYPPGASPDRRAARAFTGEAAVREMLAPYFGAVHTWPSDWGIRTEWYFECRAARA